MKVEQIKMQPKEFVNISDMLKQNGLSEQEITRIMNGNYAEFENSSQLESQANPIFQNKEYRTIIDNLSEGYSVEELASRGIREQRVQNFMSTLEANNLTVDNVKAYDSYCNGSNMILSAERGVSREDIYNGIISNLERRFEDDYNFSEQDISSVRDYLKSLNYQKPLHENYDAIKNFFVENGLSTKASVTACTSARHLDSYHHLDETMASLRDGLQIGLPSSMKVYRAVKGDYLREQVGGDLNNLVGQTVEENGFTSTSPLYDSSFAKYDDYDTVMEIYAPKGTQGTYMTPFSGYGDAEEEFLMNSNDLYFTDVQTNVVDHNGKNKTVLRALMLSRDRECYKDKDLDKESSSVESYNQQENNNSSSMETANVPARQSRFSNFLNQTRTRFGRNRMQQSKPENVEVQSKPQNNSKQQESVVQSIPPKQKENSFIKDLQSQVYSPEQAIDNYAQQIQAQEQQPQQIQQPTMPADVGMVI